jgi:ATP-dependent DNA ligase
MAAARSSYGTAATGNRTPEEAFASGDFMFVLDGQRLHGGWVLVRMKRDRTRGKRTNWLLIKHRDEFAQDGNGEAVLAEDRSIASERPMATIAAGKGRGPKPFMLASKNASDPDAVWDSNRGLAARWCMHRRLVASPGPACMSMDPGGGRHAEPRHSVEHVAPDFCLGLLIGQSSGLKSPADDGLVAKHRRFNQTPSIIV